MKTLCLICKISIEEINKFENYVEAKYAKKPFKEVIEELVNH